MTDRKPPTAQQKFDDAYITSGEIRKRLRIGRGTLSRATSRGYLPNHIETEDGALYLWERHAIEPVLKEWGERLTQRRFGPVNV